MVAFGEGGSYEVRYLRRPFHNKGVTTDFAGAILLVPAQSIVAQHLATFQAFPPRQKPGSFSIDQAMEKLMNQKGSN